MFRYIAVLSILISGVSTSVLANENSIIEKPSWKKQSAGTELSLTSVTWDGKQFVAVGHKGLILVSGDGVSWSKVDSGTKATLTTIVYAKGMSPELIAGGEGIVMTSVDGTDWKVSIEDKNKSFLMSDLFWRAGKIIGISMGKPNVMVSSDGIRWTDAKNHGGLMQSVAWGGGSYVGVGLMSSTFSSTDGVNWKNGTTGIPGALTGITYANDKFIAVGPRGLIVTSSDGKTWNKSNSGTNKGFVDILWNGKLAIAVGGQNPFSISDMMAGKKSSSEATIAYSPDGIRWGVETLDEKVAFTSVAWSQRLKKFVAVGHGGLIYTGAFDGEKIILQNKKIEAPTTIAPKRATILTQVLTTIAMKKVFQLQRAQRVCKNDLEQFCGDVTGSNKITCLQDNRNRISGKCDEFLMQEVGSKPTTEVIGYQGVNIPVNSTIFMTKWKGKLRITQAITTKGFTYKGISFETGKLYFGNEIQFPKFSGIHIFGGIVYRPPSIAFYPDGKVSAGILYEDTQIKGRIYKANTPIHFYKSGEVKSGVIAKEYVINGKVYPAGNSMKFRQDGTVEYTIQPKFGDFTQP